MEEIFLCIFPLILYFRIGFSFFYEEMNIVYYFILESKKLGSFKLK